MSAPEGRFACASAADCPSGWVCAADRRCWSAPLDAAATLDAGAFVACPEDAIACGDFEDGLGAWESSTTTGGTAEIVSEPVRSGTGALRLVTSDAEGASVHAAFPLDALAEGTLYGRALLWVDEGADLANAVVAMQLDDGDLGGADKISIDLWPEDRFALTVTTRSPGIDARTTPGTLRRGEWMCVRFQLELSDTEGSAQLHEGGDELARLDALRTVPASGAFRRFSLLVWSTAPGARELVFDAVALDDAPLDCP